MVLPVSGGLPPTPWLVRLC